MYKRLGHTADLRLHIAARTIEKLFREALGGTMEVLVEKIEKRKEVSKDIEIESADKTGLLIDFLNEALYFAYSERAIFPEAEFEFFSETKLKAKIFGYKIKNGFDKDIKAVTYHEAEIKKTDGNYEVILVFDV